MSKYSHYDRSEDGGSSSGIDTPGRTPSLSSITGSVSRKKRITVSFSAQLFPNEIKIAVPISGSTTFAELRAEALRRVSRMNLSLPTTDLILHLDAEDGPIAFDEDPVEDILDMKNNNTLWVVPAQPSRPRNSLLHIRWITPGRALDFTTISKIPTDREPIPRLTTISDLKSIAMERVYRSPSYYEVPLISTFQITLYLAQCALSTTDENGITLEDLGCSGGPTDPLNIFVVPTSLVAPNEDRPHSLWAFSCSERAIATFQTCLKVLMGEAGLKLRNLRCLLKILFRITHFPPALEALQVIGTENKLEPTAVAVLATCFRELALRMVPQKCVGSSFETVLEGSRQIFAWLHSKFRESLKDGSDLDDPEAALVRPVQLEELPEEPGDYYPSPSQRCEVVEIKASGEAMAQSSQNSKGRTLRKVRVQTHVSCQENFTLLALSLWGKYDHITNYYVDFRDNIEAPFQHRRIPLLDPSEFGRLLVQANKCDRFRMIPPKSLDGEHGEPSSGISLCKQGYVSIYTRNSGRFKDVESKLENAITGVEILKAEPGEALFQALQPIIQQRKLKGAWEVDDWEVRSETEGDDITVQNATEAIVFCFDLSWSMGSSLGDNWIGPGIENTLSRLDETKQVFKNAIARIEGYRPEQTHVGLVTFSSADKVKIRAPLSKSRRGFKGKLDDAQTTGITALWKGILKAKEMLVSFQTAHPKAKLRIVALTDGEDNDSQLQPHEVCQALYDSNIVLDSVIGTNSTSHLFRMSKHTGGYAFNPTSRLLLFQIFLLEPFLDISARPAIERVPIIDFYATTPKSADMQNLYDFPPCRPHELEGGSFVLLQAVAPFFGSRHTSVLGQSRSAMLAAGLVPDRGRPASIHINSSSTLVPSPRPLSTVTSTPSSRSSATIGRLYLDEMRLMFTHSHRFLDVYVNESDMSFWKVILQGPDSTPYERGIFLLMVHMTRNYPQTAPVVRFITPILHPNITKHGRICHSILSDGWRPSFNIYTVLQNIFGLLQSPETNDTVDELARLKFWTDRSTAETEIRNYVARFATRSRRDWEAEILDT